MAQSDNRTKFTHQFLNSNKIEVEEQGKRTTWWDEKLEKFGVRVSHTGRKTFFVMYRYNGTVKRFTIGTFKNISLKEAREKAREIQYKASNGINPQKEKEAEKKKRTFRQLVNEYRENYLKTLAQSTRREYNRIIDKYLLPKSNDRPPEEITSSDVRELMDLVVQQAREGETASNGPKAGHRMANNVRKTISSI